MLVKMTDIDLLAMAVDLTKTALQSGSGSKREILEPKSTVEYLQAVYDKLAEINDSAD